MIVLGAGLAGLSASYHLGGRCEVFEKESYVGGHARTKRLRGFNFDEGAHVFFGNDECSREFVLDPLGSELKAHRAEIWNNYGGCSFGRYPVQANAHALPPELATRCLVDFIEAHGQPEAEVKTYEEWCRASFGSSFAEQFMLRYARKVWTVEPAEMNTEWLGTKVGGRISRPNIEQVIRGAVDPNPQTLNYLTDFFYPVQGGFGTITQPIASLASNIRLDCAATAIETACRAITFSDGSVRSYDAVISTVPLPALIRSVVDAPEAVRAAAERLMWTSIRCVNLGVARSDLGPGHWVYFYDHDIPFFRISFPSKFSADNAPPGFGSISCEIAYSRRKPLDNRDLVPRVVAALRATGILRDSDRMVFEDEVDIPYAYVVFDFQRESSLCTIHRWMEGAGLYPCGRFGEWGYHWTFEAIESGRRVAARVARDLGWTEASPRPRRAADARPPG